MKRYNNKIFFMDLKTKKDGFASTCQYDEMQYSTAMEEDPNGEWVKWEDVKGKLGLAWVHCALCGANLSKGNHLDSCELNKPCEEIYIRFTESKTVFKRIEKVDVECNCDEKSNTRYPEGGFIDSWICPAHGYKRR